MDPNLLMIKQLIKAMLLNYQSPAAEEGSQFRGANFLRRKFFYGEKLNTIEDS